MKDQPYHVEMGGTMACCLCLSEECQFPDDDGKKEGFKGMVWQC